MSEFFPFIYENKEKKDVFEYLYIEIDNLPIKEKEKEKEKEQENIYIIQL